MPYIAPDERGPMTPVCLPARNAGELNFQITCLMLKYVQRQKLTYQSINDTLGAVEGAKLEFYARLARQYEDRKIQENGDLYPCI